MAWCHVAHDCKLGRPHHHGQRLAAGRTCPRRRPRINSGGVAVHHYTTIGSYSFVGGLADVLHDVPPFMLVRRACRPGRGASTSWHSSETNFRRSDRRLGGSPSLDLSRKVGLQPAREISAARISWGRRSTAAQFVAGQQEGRHGRGRELQESRVTPLRLAVVGAGHLGRIHASLDGLPTIWSWWRLSIRSKPRGKLARKPARRGGRLTRADGEIDAAIVATPTVTHHAIGMELRAVFPCSSKNHSRRRRAGERDGHAARKPNLVLQVGHVERFNPALAQSRGRYPRSRYIEARARAATAFARPISASCWT